MEIGSSGSPSLNFRGRDELIEKGLEELDVDIGHREQTEHHAHVERDR